GLGKTHLLHAIGNQSKKYQQKVLYTTAEIFFNNFLQAIKSNKQEYFKNKYRNIDVLLFDDIHDLKNKNKAQDELFYMFEHFHNTGKQLVFTCDRPPHELKSFTDRLRSRLKSGTNVRIDHPAYDARLAILETKSFEIGLNLSPDVMEFMAENISDSIRDLSGALKNIQVKMGPDISVATISEELQEFFSVEQRPLVARSIQSYVANHYNMELTDILGNRRNADISLARQVAMYLVRELTPLSTTELGREFKRHHATIVSGGKKIKKMIAADAKFAGEIESLKRELQAHC
ncbi:MAG: chromosomal replication initiator protein DnaA, partial [Spirochaetota bacterium]